MSKNVHVLIATRDAAFNDNISSFEVPTMEKNFAKKLLNAKVNKKDLNGLDEVVEALSEGTETVIPGDVVSAANLINKNNKISDFFEQRNDGELIKDLEKQQDAWKSFLMICYLNGEVVQLSLLKKLLKKSVLVSVKREFLS